MDLLARPSPRLRFSEDEWQRELYSIGPTRICAEHRGGNYRSPRRSPPPLGRSGAQGPSCLINDLQLQSGDNSSHNNTAIWPSPGAAKLGFLGFGTCHHCLRGLPARSSWVQFLCIADLIKQLWCTLGLLEGPRPSFPLYHWVRTRWKGHPAPNLCFLCRLSSVPIILPEGSSRSSR